MGTLRVTAKTAGCPGAPGSRRATLLSASASALLVIASSASIVSTYDRVSQTWDEPTHIAAGLEWFQEGSYSLHTENPPLGRLGAGIGAYLAGARLPPRAYRETNPLLLGKQVLYDGGHLRDRLSGARAGVLPFFWLTALCAWLWFRRRDALGAFIAVAAIATLPPILAHSGLATTDIPFVAVFMVVLLTLRLWLEDLTATRSMALGVALGLGIATKFTTIPFFAAAMVGFVSAAWVASRARRAFSTAVLRRAVLVVAPLALATVWLVFGLSLGRVSEYPATGPQSGWSVRGPDAAGIMGRVSRAVEDRTVPAPAFLHGLLMLSAHQHAGHLAYALGGVSQTGFWYFYPLGIAVKTPFAFLAAFGVALAVLAFRARSVAWPVGGLIATIVVGLLLMTSSRVNIGTRHVLVLYPMMAIIVGEGLSLLWRQHAGSGRKAVATGLAALLCWQVADLWRSHPDWIAYFNPLAGGNAGHVLNDSDLDWGQGLYDLEAFFTDKHVDSLTLHYSGSARLCAYDLPRLTALNPAEAPTGWVAISERMFRLALSRYDAHEPMATMIAAGFCDEAPRQSATLDRTAHSWIATATPVAYAGRTIRIYYFAHDRGGAAATPRSDRRDRP